MPAEDKMADAGEGSKNGVVIINRGDDDEGDLQGGRGSAAARAVAGKITYHVYLTHAMIEHKVNGMIQVASRVFELGLER